MIVWKITEIVMIGIELEDGLYWGFFKGHNFDQHFIDCCAADDRKMSEIIVVAFEEKRYLGWIFC